VVQVGQSGDISDVERELAELEAKLGTAGAETPAETPAQEEQSEQKPE
jgi:hypothetical protein